MCCVADTNLIFVLRSFILDEQLETFLSDKRLDVTTTSMPFLRFIDIPFGSLLFGFVCFADHFRLAMSPNNGHSCFGIANMAYFVGKKRVRLTNAITLEEYRNENCKDARMKTSVTMFGGKMRRARKGYYYDKKASQGGNGQAHHYNDNVYASHRMRRLPPASQERERHGSRDHKVRRQRTNSGHHFIFALLVQRPISPRTSCPTNTGRLQWLTRRSSDRKRALATPQQAKRLDSSRAAVVRVWGSPVDYGESPQKIGRWGAKRVELNATHDIGLKFPTVYTYTFENLFHFDNETW